MTAHVHHVHLFAHDLDASVDWYRRHLDGEVMFDGDFGAARNVFMKVGSGRLNFYAQRRAARRRGRSTTSASGSRTG